MGTIVQKLEKILETKEAIRQAIVAKGQSLASNVPFSDYSTKIRAIQTGVDTSDATAVAANILSGKTAYAKGAKITGTIATKTASNLTASGSTVTVPAGYYASNVSKSVTTVSRASPSLSVSSNGLITARVAQAEGYVEAGTISATSQLATQASQTITPGTANKTIASGRYLTGTQTIKGDANLVAANIKSGVSIFGVVGSYIGDRIDFSKGSTIVDATLLKGILSIPGGKGCKFFMSTDMVYFGGHGNDDTIIWLSIYGGLNPDGFYYGSYIESSSESQSGDINAAFGKLSAAASGTTLSVAVDPAVSLRNNNDKVKIRLFF